MITEGSQVRIDTSKCVLICSGGGCIPGHRKLNGRIGMVMSDMSVIDHDGHTITCYTCQDTVPLRQHIQETGHCLEVCVDGTHATFHPNELEDLHSVIEDAIARHSHVGGGEA